MANSRFSNEELKQLLQKCLIRDEEAWTSLFEGLNGFVRSICFRAGVARNEVDDVVGETFMKIVRSIAEVAQARNPLAYMGVAPEAMPKRMMERLLQEVRNSTNKC